MRLSQYFLPTLKENPAEAQVVSHRLMLRAGMISQTAAGSYSWLPMGKRVLSKIEQIIREEQNRVGVHEITMPTLQPDELWQESGRSDAYGKEMLRIKDRHERTLVYAPTAEEVVTDIGRRFMKSYRDLPVGLYQIQWKFRDEIRPRFGVIRGREFLMKDAYTFDVDFESAEKTYYRMFSAYQKTFARMGVAALAVQAETGPIGGTLSHEFHVLAQTGESTLFYDPKIDELKQADTLDLKALTELYAASDELHDPAKCPLKEEELRTTKGIEMGHIFYLGMKYSEAMGLQLQGADGKMFHPHMGCFGIGVTRMVAAVIEANHDEKGMIWPWPVAPFHVGILNMRVKDEATSQICEALEEKLGAMGLQTLYDDRDERAGVKFADMDLIGVPYQILVGPKNAANQQVELKNRRTGEVELLSVDEAVNALKSQQEHFARQVFQG